jgi:tRNA-uridine 2-sulfurtransferase
MSAPMGFAEHLQRPLARGHTPTGACTGAAGGAACGDLIRISLSLAPADPAGRIADAGFDASGCGATIAAGSAVVALLRGARVLDAARIGSQAIAREVGGLSPAKRHAAELAADALHRALGAAIRSQATLAGAANRTLVAMSGGVDSAVAALLTARNTDDVVAVTLELWSDPENDAELSCCSAQAVRRARSLAHDLGLPHFSIDLRAEFRAGVVDPWLAAHAAGLTPNPCVRCNGSVRLDAMLDLATRLGSRTLATGHYARIHEDRAGPLLRVAADVTKDQSYALAALASASLARLHFPLGALTKREVRVVARDAGIAVARRPDSQDLCFLAGTRQRDFLARHGRIARRPGSIVDSDGRHLGEHDGIQTVTIGQRRGLGIGGRRPLYVLATDLRANTITVGARAELLTRTVPIRHVLLRREASSVNAVKLRYRGRPLACRVPAHLSAGPHPTIQLALEQPAERTAPGQIACLYSGELVVGHGTIASSDAP